MKRAREIRHALEFAAVRGAMAMAGALPIGLARGVGATVGWLAFALGIRRRVSVDNIMAALGVSRAEAARIARRAYQNLGRGMMDFAAFKHWSREELLQQADVDGVENVVGAREAGKGVVVIAGHFGSWEICGAFIGALGFPTNLLIGEQTNARVDDVMNDLRRRYGARTIPRAQALKKVLLALRNNEVVAFLADQDARKGGVIVDFLGRPAATVRGPALFAIRAGCPIVTLSIHREGRRHRVIFDPPFWPDPSLDEEASVRDLTQRHVNALARRIREHPDEYFWPHRRWKSASRQVTENQAVNDIS